MASIRHLEYLTALARERHFARAAEVCHVAQPSLSAGIVHLEKTLGVVIIERQNRFLGLTPEGERVLAWAQRTLAELEVLHAELSAARAKDAAPLTPLPMGGAAAAPRKKKA